MNKERNIYLDILKSIDITLVVVGHCVQWGAGREFACGGFYDNPLFKFIYSFHMPLFMLISGYLFSFSVSEKKWNELLVIKFKQLIVPLCAWSVVTLGITICKMVVNGSIKEISVFWIMKELILGFVWGPWFLWAVWWCSLVIILVKTFLKDSMVVYLVVGLLTFITPDDFNFSLYKFMWPFFLIAYLFNEYDYRNKWKKIYLSKTCIACSLMFFAFLLRFFNRESYIYVSGYRVDGGAQFRYITTALDFW